jgi:hypothetical protein
MEMHDRRFGGPELLTLVGGAGFIFVLALSAYWEQDIRLLHFFQAWMYLAVIALAFRQSRWGYFIGISTAGLWNYTNLFATTFFFNGPEQLAAWTRSGHLARPDIFISVPAWVSNLMVICGCVWGYAQLPQKQLTDIVKFVAAFVLCTGFFALIIALFQPRYLGIFPRLLHPRWP